MRALTAVAVLVLTAACAAPRGADVSFGRPPGEPRAEAVGTVPAATSSAAPTPGAGSPGAASAATRAPAETPGPATPETIPPSPPPPGAPRELGQDEDAEIGRPYRHQLYTHCGITATWRNGAWWDASPPVSDGNGNPPPGWGNPYQDGVMTQVSATRLEFLGDQGQRAEFVPRPAADGAPPPCD